MNGGGQVVAARYLATRTDWTTMPPRYLSLLLYSTRWEQREIQLFGKDVLSTRLLQFVSSGSRVCLRVKTGPQRWGFVFSFLQKEMDSGKLQYVPACKSLKTTLNLFELIFMSLVFGTSSRYFVFTMLFGLLSFWIEQQFTIQTANDFRNSRQSYSPAIGLPVFTNQVKFELTNRTVSVERRVYCQGAVRTLKSSLLINDGTNGFPCLPVRQKPERVA